MSAAIAKQRADPACGEARAPAEKPCRRCRRGRTSRRCRGHRMRCRSRRRARAARPATRSARSFKPGMWTPASPAPLRNRKTSAIQKPSAYTGENEIGSGAKQRAADKYPAGIDLVGRASQYRHRCRIAAEIDAPYPAGLARSQSPIRGDLGHNRGECRQSGRGSPSSRTSAR